MNLTFLGTHGGSLVHKSKSHTLATAYSIGNLLLTSSLQHPLDGISRAILWGGEAARLEGHGEYLHGDQKDAMCIVETVGRIETYSPIVIDDDTTVYAIPLQGGAKAFIATHAGFKYVIMPQAAPPLEEADMDGTALFIGDGYCLSRSKDGHYSMREQIELCDKHNIQRIIFSNFGDGIVKVGDKYALRSLDNILPPAPGGADRHIVFARDGQSMALGEDLKQASEHIDLNAIDFPAMQDADLLMAHMHVHQLSGSTLDTDFINALHSILAKEMITRGFAHDSPL